MTRIQQLAELGQAVWLDFLDRDIMNSGELQRLIDEGVRGITANPTIVGKAITGTSDYDADMQRLIAEGKTVAEIYEGLIIPDIQRAADFLRPEYDRLDGADGYVSLEVRPGRAYDEEGTISEARHLFAKLDRPNVMIKVPATEEGYGAIRALTARGINVNVTLIFSLEQYEKAADAYQDGLEALAGAGAELSRVASVASFFVSRVDTAVDKQLEVLGEMDLMGNAAIAIGAGA
jgi:transaldolase